MQKTYKGMTAQQIIKTSTTTNTDGQKFTFIDGVFYTVVIHDRVELANGDWTGTVVLENAHERIVLKT